MCSEDNFKPQWSFGTLRFTADQQAQRNLAEREQKALEIAAKVRYYKKIAGF